MYIGCAAIVQACTFTSNDADGGSRGLPGYEEPNAPGSNGDGFGGAIFVAGASTITNSTLSGDQTNGGTRAGAGIYSASHTLTISDCTIANESANFGFGAGIDAFYKPTVNNTILANNIGGDLNGSGIQGQYNLIDDSTYLNDANLTNTINADPLLGALANNGGPTQTMARLAGSPAIAAGSLALVPSGATTDQRGYVRTFNNAVDIGAYRTATVLTSIAVTPNNSSNPKLAAGVSAPFTATGTYAGGIIVNITNSVTWASATPAVATIGGTGLATALAPGTSVITASLAGVTSAGVTLTVLAPSFVVNTILDLSGFYTGVTSLRQAIAEASAVASGQAVTFDPTVFATAQTITLTAGPLTPSNTSGKLTITGPASPAARVSISGNSTSRVFQMAASGMSVEWDNLTITAGLAQDNGVAGAAAGSTAALGGAIVNNGGNLNFSNGNNLTFNNVTFTSDRAMGGAGQAAMGGAVYTAGGTVSFINCTFTSDTAQGGEWRRRRGRRRLLKPCE